MRIGIDARLWMESGVGRYIRNLVKNLLLIDKKNEYVLFVLSKDYEEIKAELLIKNDKWKIVKTDIKWHTLSEQLKFPSLLYKENLDLVHFPYFSVPVFYNKPFVITIHDLIINHFPTGTASTLPSYLYNLKLMGYNFIISEASKKTKKIITVSNATKKEIIEHLRVPEDKIEVTYEGVGKEFSNSNFQIPNNSQNTKYKILNTKYFLYVGNAYPHKNLERLLEAFKSLKFKYPDVSLVLVGKEDYFSKRLKDKVKSVNIDNKIIFYGEVKDSELINLYKNAKALIMPSLMEGFGLPLIEGMANKCTILCSDIEVFKEICKDAAFYFNPKDILDIVNKIEELYLNKEKDLEKRKEIGLERSKLFSWEKMARETLKIYESSISV